MIVVSNTSPITNLAAIGHLDLLSQLFGRLLVPQAVVEELSRGHEHSMGRVIVGNIEWLESRPVGDAALVASLTLELDPGEAEAIALAHEVSAQLVLMDERRGRHVAKKLGLTPLGLLGVLVLAKRRGLIDELRPLLDELANKAGFWIGEELFAQILREASEQH